MHRNHVHDAEPDQAFGQATRLVCETLSKPLDSPPWLAHSPTAGISWAMSTVKIETSKGDITLELDAEKAPATVENFLAYVDAGHYEGTIFHRVIDGFMAQGGGYDEALKKKPTRDPVTNEADNGRKNTKGTVAMARTSDPHSATAQFFINVSDNAFLDHTAKTPQGWGYCVFGEVANGMDVVEAIRNVDTGAKGPFTKDAPQEDIVIRRVTRL